MRSATRVTASVLGAYAGLLSAAHGVFETLQGNSAPDGAVINAIGAPCQADAVWHACLPALTVIPSLLVSGILAITVGLGVLIWATAFIQRKHTGVILLLLSAAMLLVGGGFVPAYTGILGGLAGTRIRSPLTRWRTRLSGRPSGLLARLFPWTVAAFVAWSLGGWVLGHFFNQTMLRLGSIPFFLFDLGLPLLTLFTGLVYDVRESDRDATR